MSITIGTHPNNLATWILAHTPHLQASLRAVTDVAFVTYDDGRQTMPYLVDGTIDVGATGTTPPISAQAEGLDVVYLAASESHPDPGGIVVPADSPIRELADLAGRSIAFAVGSWQTHALAVAVDRAGIAWDDVTILDVPATAHAQEFLDTGADAWLLVDPTYTGLAGLVDVRVVAPTESLVHNRSMFFGRGAWVRENPETVAAYVAALGATEQWAAEHVEEVAALLSTSKRGGHPETWLPALTRRHWGVHPMSGEVVAEQQHAADLFHRFGVIDRSVAVVAAVAAL
ncbi:ABC transporter substrate-binding protein [Nocardioides carbamazepini]|uniref:ABC transporter substrate-binding protein n=1 Tax=Nocardioides carbamazepini TaxID=2854259 RepID=UPI002149DA24|nr:ABC transporter substrate-binding protein [Nocardioides carbamazepini]MCR1785822.1 ABC transporter substrate-binding protein [Nocardioides carbamazepini]